MGRDDKVWTELIAALPGVTVLRPPARAGSLREAPDLLGHQLPSELISLLSESDGVEGEYGMGLVWSIDQIVKENLALRRDTDLARLYMPFDPLLFFGDAGNGDLFALVPHTGGPDVYAWNHENDSRIWVAGRLAQYLEWWLSGKILL